MSDTDELKPCPFCGAKQQDTDPKPYKAGMSRGCDVCRVTSWQWNTRPIEDKLRTEIMYLEAQNTKLREALNQRDKVIQNREAAIAALTHKLFGKAGDK